MTLNSQYAPSRAVALRIDMFSRHFFLVLHSRVRLPRPHRWLLPVRRRHAPGAPGHNVAPTILRAWQSPLSGWPVYQLTGNRFEWSVSE